MNRKQFVRLAPTIIMVSLAALIWFGRYQIIDAWRLRGYQPDNAVQQLAEQTGMTRQARTRFYVNHPDVSDKTAFQQKCPNGDSEEKTIVLGCYIAGQRGIHVLRVDDSRLQGVEQVTAAHEMLHAAYERLSSSERSNVDAMLRSYAASGLNDQRIKDILKTYQRTEPGEQNNEMHSIFGTEIDQLPPALEAYYARYFDDRSKVAAYAAQYQAAFTSRRQAVDEYDRQLDSQKKQIDTAVKSLGQQSDSLRARGRQLDGLRTTNPTAYNAAVPAYNSAIDQYNSLASQTRQQISAYNALIEKRNSIALEERQLNAAINGNSVPSLQ